MGNAFGHGKTAKVMTISGETRKFRAPVKAKEVVEGYPGHVVMESEDVKHYGARAKPLKPDDLLVPKRLYFLVELPNQEGKRSPRKVRSGIAMSAKDRLENLALARRSASDLTLLKATCSQSDGLDAIDGGDGSTTRVKVRLPKAEVERLMRESKDEAETAARIMELCIGRKDSEEEGAPTLGRDREKAHRVLESVAEEPMMGPAVVNEKKVTFILSSDTQVGVAPM